MIMAMMRNDKLYKKKSLNLKIRNPPYLGYIYWLIIVIIQYTGTLMYKKKRNNKIKQMLNTINVYNIAKFNMQIILMCTYNQSYDLHWFC